MNVQEQLRAFQQKRNEAAERQTELMAKAGDEGRTLDDDESSEYDGLATEIGHLDAHLKRLRNHVEAPSKTEEIKGRGPTILVRKEDPEDQFEGQSFVRRAILKAIATMENFERTPSQIAADRWGKSHPKFVEYVKSGMPLGMGWLMTKAGVAGGGTGSGEWGAELVQADSRYTGDFIEYLDDKTVYYQLPLREVPAHVVIKGQDGTATGYWVGESKAIPVSAQDYSTVSLTPLKVAAISTCSNELLKHSSPAAEMLIRDRLAAASIERIDTTFVSATAVSAGVSPAGILNGLSALGSNGFDGAAVRADIRELRAPFITAKHALNLVLLMSPARASATGLIVNTLGQTEFPGIDMNGGTLLGHRVVTGNNIADGTVIMIDPSEVWRIGDTGIEVSLSRDATIEQDSAPQGAGDSPTAASATLMSMYQEEMTAFKVVRPTNYQKRRSTAVAFIDDAGWGDSTSTTT